jgi:tetratricopeptide (TPR) repeat protein
MSSTLRRSVALLVCIAVVTTSCTCVLAAPTAPSKTKPAAPQVTAERAKALAYYDQGMACLGRNETEKACEHLKSATVADPSFATAFFELGRIAHGRKQWATAIDWLKKGLAVDAASAEAQSASAMLAEAEAAKSAYEASDEGKRAMAYEGFVQAARDALAAEKTDEAGKALAQAAQTDATRPEHMVLLGQLYQRQGNAANARKAYERAVAASPESRSAAEAQAALREMDNAQLFDESLAAGRAALAGKNLPEAVVQLGKAHSLCPEREDVSLAFACALMDTATNEPLAASLFEALVKSSDDKIASRAQSELARARLRGLLAAAKDLPIQKTPLDDTPRINELRGRLLNLKRMIVGLKGLAGDAADDAAMFGELGGNLLTSASMAPTYVEAGVGGAFGVISIIGGLFAKSKAKARAERAHELELRYKELYAEMTALRRLPPPQLAAEHFAGNQMFPEAELAYQMLIDQDPTNHEYQAGLAFVHWSQGRPDEAERAFTRAIQLAPNVPDYPDRLRDLKAGMAPRESMLQAAVKHDPRNPNAHVALGEYLSTLKGREKDAEKPLNMAKSIVPQWWRPFGALAELYLKTGRKAQAMQTYLQAARLAPEDPALQVRAADVCYEMKNYATARRMYLSATESQPDNADYQLKLAECLVKLNQLRPAKIAAMQAKALGVKDHPLFVKLGL